MKQSRSSKHLSPDSEFEKALTDTVFMNGLRAFDAQARLARKGFQVVMAAKVFGVGTLLDNNLPGR